MLYRQKMALKSISPWKYFFRNPNKAYKKLSHVDLTSSNFTFFNVQFSQESNTCFLLSYALTKSMLLTGLSPQQPWKAPGKGTATMNLTILNFHINCAHSSQTQSGLREMDSFVFITLPPFLKIMKHYFFKERKKF